MNFKLKEEFRTNFYFMIKQCRSICLDLISLQNTCIIIYMTKLKFSDLLSELEYDAKKKHCWLQKTFLKFHNINKLREIK